MNNGIECENCGCRHNTVTHVERREVRWHGRCKVILRRRRVCRHCGLSFYTRETYDDPLQQEEPPPNPPPQEDPPPKSGPPANPYL